MLNTSDSVRWAFFNLQTLNDKPFLGEMLQLNEPYIEIKDIKYFFSAIYFPPNKTYTNEFVLFKKICPYDEKKKKKKNHFGDD